MKEPRKLHESSKRQDRRKETEKKTLVKEKYAQICTTGIGEKMCKLNSFLKTMGCLRLTFVDPNILFEKTLHLFFWLHRDL